MVVDNVNGFILSIVVTFFIAITIIGITYIFYGYEVNYYEKEGYVYKKEIIGEIKKNIEIKHYQIVIYVYDNNDYIYIDDYDIYQKYQLNDRVIVDYKRQKNFMGNILLKITKKEE